MLVKAYAIYFLLADLDLHSSVSLWLPSIQVRRQSLTQRMASLSHAQLSRSSASQLVQKTKTIPMMMTRLICVLFLLRTSHLMRIQRMMRLVHRIQLRVRRLRSKPPLKLFSPV